MSPQCSQCYGFLIRVAVPSVPYGSLPEVGFLAIHQPFLLFAFHLHTCTNLKLGSDSLIGHVGEKVVGAVGWRGIQHGYLLNTPQDLLVPALREVTVLMSRRLKMCTVQVGIISKANKFRAM